MSSSSLQEVKLSNRDPPLAVLGPNFTEPLTMKDATKGSYAEAYSQINALSEDGHST